MSSKECDKKYIKVCENCGKEYVYAEDWSYKNWNGGEERRYYKCECGNGFKETIDNSSRSKYK